MRKAFYLNFSEFQHLNVKLSSVSLYFNMHIAARHTATNQAKLS